jgi:hypothetical protein
LHFHRFSDIYSTSLIKNTGSTDNNSATPEVDKVENNQSGIGTGTILLSFITGVAAGIAAALLIDAARGKKLVSDDQEDQLFI